MPQAILGNVLTLIFGDLLRARHSAPPASRLQSRLIASPRPPLQWTEVAGHLGRVLANAVTLLNPSRLVLGGGVWQGTPELRRRTLAVFESQVNRASLEGFAVGDTVLGDSAGMLGAAALISSMGGPA